MQPAFARLLTVAAIVSLGACAPPASVVGVTIEGGDLEIDFGSSASLTATVATTGAAATDVTWTSSDPNVATVDADGIVTGLIMGTTNVTATSTFDATQSDEIAVTVVAPEPAWSLQFGTAATENASDLATDASGHVYVVGSTNGDLEGVSAGGYDAFVRSYDNDGGLRWTRQFGTTSNEFTSGVATDTNGHVYVVGQTRGDLEGPNAGSADAFIRSYDADGNFRWGRQLGTIEFDRASGIAIDANDRLYVLGTTSAGLDGLAHFGDRDIFVWSYDADGDVLWTRQFGTSGFDDAAAVTIDESGFVYVVGTTSGDLEGASNGLDDAFVRSYDAAGGVRWTRQFGTPDYDYADAVAADGAGTILVGGVTLGDLAGANAGGVDAFVRAYGSDGTEGWGLQFGTAGDEAASGIVADGDGIHIVGNADGAFAGTHSGEDDGYVLSLAPGGTVRWTSQFGTSSSDFAPAVTTDASGAVFVLGRTNGDLDGPHLGEADVFLRRYGP